MVDGLFHPLNIYILALGAGFLIPLFYRVGWDWALAAFYLALGGMTLVAGVSLQGILGGGPSIEILTAGIEPPFAINLRFGLFEGIFAFCVNLAALLGAWHFQDRLRTQAAAMLLYIILVMGINGMIMTRDLFNLFIFIEITAIATYGLLGFERTAAALAAGFKYIIATALASALFLLGTIFLYYLSGTLNIDDMLAEPGLLAGPIGFTATLLLLSSLLIELKPYPANGNYMLIDGTITGKSTEEILKAALDEKIYLQKIGEIHGKTGWAGCPCQRRRRGAF